MVRNFGGQSITTREGVRVRAWSSLIVVTFVQTSRRRAEGSHGGYRCLSVLGGWTLNSVVKVSAQYRESEFTAVTNWTTCRTDDTETLVRILRGGRSGSREWFSIRRAGNRERERVQSAAIRAEREVRD